MKELRFILVMMIVVVVVWVGFGVFFSSSNIKINPNADSYVQPLNKAFNLDGFDKMVIRVEENLPVSPGNFIDLTQVESN